MDSRLGMTVLLGASPAAPALAQQTPRGWAGELWPRGGAAEGNRGGTTGAGAFDGAARYTFDNGMTARAEGQGNALLGSDGAGGKLQAWWQDPSLGLIGGFAEASRREGLWQRR